MAKPSIAARAAAAKTEAPAFTLIVSGDLGPYKGGDTLSTKAHIVAYVRAMLDEGADEPTPLTDDQIYAGVQAVDVTGLAPDDADVSRVQYLQTLASSLDTPLGDTLTVVAEHSDVAKGPIGYGQMVDDAFEKAVDQGVDGKKEYDGAPIMIENHLVRIFGKVVDSEGVPVMKQWPKIGSRRQGTKNDNVKPDYQGPVDFYLTTDRVTGKPIKGRWLNHFVDATPRGSALSDRLAMVKALIRREDIRGVPEDLEKIKDNAVKLDGVLRDTVADRAGHINRVGRAIAYWQHKTRASEELPKVRVRLADGNDLHASARRNKPIELCNVEKNTTTGEVELIAAPRITLTKFLNMDIDKAKASGGTVAALEATSKRGTKNKGTSPTAENGTAKFPAISTAMGVLDHCDAVALYLDTEAAEGNIRRAITAKDGGALASRIVAMFDNLRKFGEDASIRKIASAYDHMQTAAVAAAAEATDPTAPKKATDKAA